MAGESAKGKDDMKALAIIVLVLWMPSAAAFESRNMESSQTMADASMELVFSQVRSLLLLKPLDLREVERITGLKFSEDSERSLGNFTVFRSGPSDGRVFRSGEIRLPMSPSTQRDGILILNVGATIRIRLVDVIEAFGKVSRLSRPPEHSESNVPQYFNYLFPDERLAFGFDRKGDERLVSIVIDRTQPVR